VSGHATGSGAPSNKSALCPFFAVRYAAARPIDPAPITTTGLKLTCFWKKGVALPERVL
jgi:hypothetical protein